VEKQKSNSGNSVPRKQKFVNRKENFCIADEVKIVLKKPVGLQA